VEVFGLSDFSKITLFFWGLENDSYVVSSIVRRVLDWDVLVSGGGVRVSDVTRGEGV